MSNVSNGGYIAQDPGMTAADLQSIKTLSQSKDNSSTTNNQAAIQELAGSQDSLANNLGSALSGQTYNYQAVHDMIWAVDHDKSALTDPSGSVIDAALSTQNDTNPNIQQSDKSNLMNWAEGEIAKQSDYYNNNQNDYSNGYQNGYGNGYDNGFDNGYGYGAGNNDYGQGNNGYGQGNNGFDTGNNGYGQGNNGYGQGNNGYGQGNNGFDTGNNGYGQGNNGYGQGNNGFDTGNNGYGQGNNGFNYGGNNQSGSSSEIFILIEMLSQENQGGSQSNLAAPSSSQSNPPVIPGN